MAAPSSPIPTDLMIEIFSRLPAKSVARYHCLSKFWSKVISSQYFKNLFAARSSARPQILILERNESGGLLFFSASHPSSSDNVATTRLTHYPLSSRYIPDVTVPINGLVCVTEAFDIIKRIHKMYKAVIYNPSTRELLNLPTRTYCGMRDFLGYDPIEKRLKVLSLEFPGWKNFEWGPVGDLMDSQVLTLETEEELSWRMIECCEPHHPLGSEICINGVLYYRAFGVFNVQLIVCFDVRSETFKFMKGTKTFDKEPSRAVALINYDGKLGLLMIPEGDDFVTGKSKSFEIWVLKDVEKDEWSKHIYILPPLWKTVVGETKLRFVGMIGTNEIVLSSGYQNTTTRPCFFYYNIEKDTVRKLNIQGEEGLTKSHDIFLNYVEDLSFFKLI